MHPDKCIGIGRIILYMRGVIAYLTQSGRHSSYKTDRHHALHKSVELLFGHYNRQHKNDVIFFHDGTFGESQQRSVLSRCKGAYARFIALERDHFIVPPGVNPQKWKYVLKYSAGYRHMARFFTVGIWDVIAQLGYTHVMRLDDDSYIWSPIRYDIFEFMHSHQLQYGFRLGSWERGHPFADREHFHDVVNNFARRARLDLRWLLAPCLPRRHEPQAARNLTLRNCGNLFTVYNNFFVTEVAWWRANPDVKRFVSFVNDSRLIYTERFGDALWHSVALALFMEPSRLHIFNDWAYEHASFSVVDSSGKNEVRNTAKRTAASKARMARGQNRTCLLYGAIVVGNGTGIDMALAHQRLGEFSSNALSCDEGRGNPSCVHIGPDGEVVGIFNHASPEGPFCDGGSSTGLMMRPYHCTQFDRPIKTHLFNNPSDEMVALLAECEVLVANASNKVVASARMNGNFNPPNPRVVRKQASREQRFCTQRAIMLHDRRQRRHVCTDFCTHPIFTARPGDPKLLQEFDECNERGRERIIAMSKGARQLTRYASPRSKYVLGSA